MKLLNDLLLEFECTVVLCGSVVSAPGEGDLQVAVVFRIYD